jgi:hypothetical protein
MGALVIRKTNSALLPMFPAEEQLMAESWNDQGWHTYTHDGVDGQPRVVTCHSKIIGGVLCRWWGRQTAAGRRSNAGLSGQRRN